MGVSRQDIWPRFTNLGWILTVLAQIWALWAPECPDVLTRTLTGKVRTEPYGNHKVDVEIVAYN